MLPFDSCIQISADLKTQPSTVNWVEQNKCTPASIWRINFQRLLLLHPPQKHFESAEDVDGVPLGTFFGTISKKNFKNVTNFFSLFFVFFLFLLLLSATDWVLVSAYFWILDRTTTLIPFLRAIWNFCNFIHSYFMDRFAFLIDHTS